MSCLANFGEILEPTSRAFWDGFDEEYEDPEIQSVFLSKAEWSWQNEEILHEVISKLIIIEGSGMAEFLRTMIFKDLQPVGMSKNQNCLAYYFPNSKQLIIHSEENDLNFSGIYSMKIDPIVQKAEQVITFSLQSKIQYKANDLKQMENQITFLRGINSQYNYAKELKAPNFITGLCAGVASLRHINNLSINSYIAYTEPCNELDAISAQPILKLFQDIGIKCDNKYVAKMKDQSHLYM